MKREGGRENGEGFPSPACGREDRGEGGIFPSPFPLPPSLRFLGTVEYEPTWRAMQQFTAQRTAETRDEIWLVQHPPTYTQGQAGKPEHLLNGHNIPVVQIVRGGQITYHGPGQVVAY